MREISLKGLLLGRNFWQLKKLFQNNEKDFLFFYFVWKALSILKMFKFLFWLFGHVGKWLDNKAKFIFKIHDLKDWQRNNYNTHIT